MIVDSTFLLMAKWTSIIFKPKKQQNSHPIVGAITDEVPEGDYSFDSLLSAGELISDFIYGFAAGTAIIQGTLTD